MGTVVGLTFLFGFGNVLSLALRLGVPVWVAPLVAPAVDLSILGLLLGIRHLVLCGAVAAQLRPARRLLVFASVVTLALNVADPLLAGQYGKAAFDAVGPLLLIGWAEVGPGLLSALSSSRSEAAAFVAEPSAGRHMLDVPRSVAGPGAASVTSTSVTSASAAPRSGVRVVEPAEWIRDAELLERARKEDARHWEEHHRPISAETLRRELRVGAARSRLLVALIRAVGPGHLPDDLPVSAAG
jgi:hypothetical protein